MMATRKTKADLIIEASEAQAKADRLETMLIGMCIYAEIPHKYKHYKDRLGRDVQALFESHGVNGAVKRLDELYRNEFGEDQPAKQ